MFLIQKACTILLFQILVSYARLFLIQDYFAHLFLISSDIGFAVFTLQPSGVSPCQGPVWVLSGSVRLNRGGGEGEGGTDGILTEGSSSGVSHVFVDN